MLVLYMHEYSCTMMLYCVHSTVYTMVCSGTFTQLMRARNNSEHEDGESDWLVSVYARSYVHRSIPSLVVFELQVQSPIPWNSTPR